MAKIFVREDAMITINKKIPAAGSLAGSSLAKQQNSFLFFDIETTGFSKDHTILYLIGCGFFEGDTFHFFQWFNEDGTSEEEILLAFSEIVQKKKWRLVTFNGNSFDIPYLKRHYELNELPCPLDRCSSLDFYVLLNPFKLLFEMDHGKQKNWESFLGLHREDEFNGGELIPVYKEYLMKKDDALLEELLLHNAEDVLGMKHLLPLLSYRCLLLGNFSLDEIRPGSTVFPESSGSVDILCTLPLAAPHPLTACSKAGNVTISEKEVLISLPFFEGILKHYYRDYRNYYFLPKENRAVHKSIGRYVDRKYRQQAKASTCYIEKEGIFLPVPKAQKHFGFHISRYKWQKKFPLYKKDLSEKSCFAEFDDIFNTGKEQLPRYLSDTVKRLFIACLEEKNDAGLIEG